jgi:hypothetical protein
MRRVFAAVIPVIVLALLAAGIVTAAHTDAAATGTCAQLAKLKTVFPRARTVGFQKRGRIVPTTPRAPIWPGLCGGWSTTYRRSGRYLEIRVALYHSWPQALVALAEPAHGPVQVLATQVHMRTGAGSNWAGVASVVRNVFVSSYSVRVRVVPVSAQVPLHRRIHKAVLALGRA